MLDYMEGLRIDTEARKASEDRLHPSLCPYERGSEQYKAWMKTYTFNRRRSDGYRADLQGYY